MLAALDARSYHRALVQDANRIVERILQPMSLPWTHKVVPVARNLPCDIDELIELITLDDGLYTPFENGNFGFGRFDTGQLRSSESSILLANSSDTFRAATRRSNDPGIIEFITISLPPNPLETTSRDNNVVVTYPMPNDTTKGESELRCFEMMQAIKKRKVIQARNCVRTMKLSVRINSSSSRSSILKEVTKQPNGPPSHLLEVSLPQEVQSGRKLSHSQAKVIADKLGTYNVRHNLGPTHQSGKYSNRIAVGRTRVMWTEKSSCDQPQRVFFPSLLTGDRLDGGSHKRPKDVLLCIKIDGKVFNGRPKQRTIGAAIEPHAFTHDLIPFQAALDCDKFVESLLSSDSEPMNIEAYRPPKLECVPDSCGCIHVVCTSPGSISRLSVNQLLRNAAGKDNPCCTICWQSTEVGMEVKECSRCGIPVHVECCLDRGLSKGAMISVNGTSITEWSCPLCCRDEDQRETCSSESSSKGGVEMKKSRRKSRLPDRLRDSFVETHLSQKQECLPSDTNSKKSTAHMKCAVCLLPGGAMSRFSRCGTMVWVHEVCRIWTSGETISSKSNRQLDVAKGQCAACGEDGGKPLNSPSKRGKPSRLLQNMASGCLVTCAAVGCQVAVHPMCALVSSLACKSTKEWIDQCGSKERDDVDKVTERDAQLCRQFTLTCVTIQGTTDAFGKDPGVNRTQTLPIIFCGIHNPKRERSFYGLPPGGNHLNEDTFRIPRCKEPEGDQR